MTKKVKELSSILAQVSLGELLHTEVLRK